MLSLSAIRDARRRLDGWIVRTPLLRCPRLDEALGCEVYLKPEMFQLTGSFKARGAFNRTLQLTRGELDRGIITSSSGNHAQACAYAGQRLQAKATIVIPAGAPKAKVERTRAMGAEVILFDGGQAERWQFVRDLARERGSALVHAFDDPEVMAGQGTIALEILEDLPDVDMVVAPLGGGGLLSGISIGIKECSPKVQVVGVEPAAAPEYRVSRAQGRPTDVPAGPSLADGVRADMACPFAHSVFQRYVDDLVTAEERDIAVALKLLLEGANVFAEGAAAVGVAAFLAGQVRTAPGAKVCFVLSGGNWDLDRFAAAVR